MRNLSPSDIYWITLVGIAVCFLAMGYALGMLRGGKIAYNDGYEDGASDLRKALIKAERMSKEEFQTRVLDFTDLKTPPTWITDEPADGSLVTHPARLGGAQ